MLAARQLGLATVPVIELAHLTEAQRRAYILADNRLAEQAGWDRDLLAIEVADLAALGVDLGSIGFAACEIDALLRGGAPDPREDEVPPVPAVPVSRPGDLWCLGPHRLICGDATGAATVARVLGGRTRPDAIVPLAPVGAGKYMAEIGLTPAARSRIAIDTTGAAHEPIRRIEVVIVRPGEVNPEDGQVIVTPGEDGEADTHTLRLDSRI